MKIVEHICQNGQTLQVLDLSECKGLCLEIIQCIVTKCVELSELNLDSEYIDYDRVEDDDEEDYLSSESLSFLCQNITTKIRKLSLWRQPFVNDQHIKNLLTRCRSITELNICSKNVSDSVVPYLSENLSDSLVKLGLRRVSNEKLNDLRSMSKLKYLYLPLPLRKRESKTLPYPWTLPWIKFTNEISIASPFMPYYDEAGEEEAKIQIWDVSAKQIDIDLFW